MTTLAHQLQSANLGVFPCRPDKSPAIPRGADWRDVATQPVDSHAWPCGVLGIPVPPGVMVIDLDVYKGVTRADVERALGAPLPWDAALLQTTQRGGEHYAFQVSDTMRQGSNLLDTPGFDTRMGGAGYICTGEGYTFNGFGVFRLAEPGALPQLPAPCQSALRRPEPTITSDTHANPPPDMPTVIAALRHIDPACSRSAWVKVGMALRSWAGDDPGGTALAIYDHWSSGVLGDHETPPNYVPEHVPWQWDTFKPDGDVQIGSLFYEAIQAGWRPPSTLDTSMAFGPGGTTADTFNRVVDAIQSHGCDPKQTDRLLSDIRGACGNKLQTATLLALLTRELKDAGLLTRPIRQQLDTLAGDTDQPRARGEYGKNHTENATLYLEKHYPAGGLIRSDQTWYAYTGTVWAEVSEDDMKRGVAIDMASSLPQYPVISGTYSVMCSLCQRTYPRINQIPDHLILFQNGILDLTTGQLGPHSAELFTTVSLPYEYRPDAVAPTWGAFLNTIFEGDAERIALLQEWFGYVMSNSNDHHKIMLLLGAPRSGKGTIGRVMEQIVGPENYTGASLHAFTSDPFLESLVTKSVAFSGDTERRVARNKVDIVIERLKKISGGDAVTFSRKWKSTLSQTLPTRIVLAGNHVPALFDDSGALAGRLLVLPFDVCFSGREDLTLYGRLLPELSGIATWALDGLRRLVQNGRFTVPAASEAETQFIEESFSPLTVFVRDVCRIDPGDPSGTWGDELYAAYRAWAVQNSEGHILARRTFIAAFKDVTRGHGCHYTIVRKDGGAKRGFTHLTLREVETVSTAAFKPAVVGDTQ